MSYNFDCYRILEVDPSADPSTIEEAYRRLSERYSRARDGATEERLRELRAAYAILSDPEQRRAYDERRAARLLRFGEERPEEAMGIAERALGPSWRVPWSLGDMAKALGVSVLLAIAIITPAFIVAEGVSGDVAVDADPEALAVVLTGNFIWQIVTIAVVLRFTIFKYGLSWSALGFRAPRSMAMWFLPLGLLIASWAVIAAYAVILEVVGGPSLTDQEQIPEVAFDSSTTLPIVALISLLGAPLSEEILFRGFLFQGLRTRWGVAAASVASGVLFGVVHIVPVLIVPFALVGVIFAIGYAYSGSIYVPMAAHFLFNGVSLAISVTAV